MVGGRGYRFMHYGFCTMVYVTVVWYYDLWLLWYYGHRFLDYGWREGGEGGRGGM